MRLSLAPVSLLWLSCGSPISQPNSSGVVEPKISFEPSAGGSGVANVVHVRLESATLGAGEVGIFQGELSSYYLARIKSGDLPDTLAARQVPVVSWRASGALVLSPTRPLAMGDYSLAASSGLVGEFQVATALPLLSRLWPPAPSTGRLAHVVYCGDGSAELGLEPLDFEPGPIRITPLPGVDESGLFGERCLYFDSDAQLGAGEIVAPPPLSGVWALDPAPFSGAAAEPAAELACAENEISLAVGCALVADDRVTVHTPAPALLWVLHSAHGSVLEVTRASGAFVVRGLSPSSSEHVWGRVYDESGSARAFDVVLSTKVARERPVLNEVLANALGPEPQSEWIELVNDGALLVDLSHFALRDGGGTMALPNDLLRPGEYALLVRDDYAPSASDVPPAEGARLIRVPQLGTSGLSNSGENLALVDGSSVVVSAMPALAAKAGQSLARRHTYTPDDDPSGFTTGTPTPGGPND